MYRYILSRKDKEIPNHKFTNYAAVYFFIMPYKYILTLHINITLMG